MQQFELPLVAVGEENLLKEISGNQGRREFFSGVGGEAIRPANDSNLIILLGVLLHPDLSDTSEAFPVKATGTSQILTGSQTQLEAPPWWVGTH